MKCKLCGKERAKKIRKTAEREISRKITIVAGKEIPEIKTEKIELIAGFCKSCNRGFDLDE
jgi:hypothetical protein